MPRVEDICNRCGIETNCTLLDTKQVHGNFCEHCTRFIKEAISTLESGAPNMPKEMIPVICSRYAQFKRWAQMKGYKIHLARATAESDETIYYCITDARNLLGFYYRNQKVLALMPCPSTLLEAARARFSPKNVVEVYLTREGYEYKQPTMQDQWLRIVKGFNEIIFRK
jgi:hypothetical protein